MTSERELQGLIAKWRELDKRVSLAYGTCADELEKLLAAAPAPTRCSVCGHVVHEGKCTTREQLLPKTANKWKDCDCVAAPTPAPPTRDLRELVIYIHQSLTGSSREKAESFADSYGHIQAAIKQWYLSLPAEPQVEERGKT